MKKIVLFVLFGLLFGGAAFSQSSCGLRLSLLTCAPGEELYSTFGHTAIRVADSASGIDEVYNYGTFAFSPDFYYEFVKGKLLYALSVEEFQNFVLQYQAESRSIIEQELNLSCEQKQQLVAALRLNALPENRYYRYDFLFDNCTTRARDIIAMHSGGVVKYPLLFPEKQPTFRQLIYVYLNKGNQDWSKLGIDLLLGAKLDRQASNIETMFLPDNLMKGFGAATVAAHPLVAVETPMLVMPYIGSESYLLTPVVVFLFLLLAIGLLSFIKSAWAQRLVSAFDFVLFFMLGCIGILLLFMWFGTDHQLCANNYNLLWAPPTHLAAAFFLHKKKRWLTVYLRVTFWVTVGLLLLWAFLPQQLNIALLPLILLIALRSYLLSTSHHANPRTTL